MITCNSVLELRAAIACLRQQGETVGFVPTMGFLHEGHLALVRLAKNHTSRVVVSIFVNPSQFNDARDFEAYPIDLDRDRALLDNEGVDLLFLPSRQEVYEPDFQSWVTVDRLSEIHEGEFRPGHFRGVATVVTLLFNMVQPDCAVFGEKDFQQLRIIEKLVQDLHLPIAIIRGPLIRETDGLAMSSRNVRLSPAARAAALKISEGLFRATTAFKGGERQASELCRVVHSIIADSPLIQEDYIRVVEEKNLMMLETVTPPARILVAAQVGGVRLIDNVGLELQQLRHILRC